MDARTAATVPIARSARIAAVDAAGAVWLADPDGPRRARLLAGLAAEALTAGVSVLVVEDRDDPRPIVVGAIIDTLSSAAPAPARLELAARERIVLRCGEAVLTMTRLGRVTLAGSHVESRSTGVNAIKGGAVRIN